jgi:hypothetical protein
VDHQPSGERIADASPVSVTVLDPPSRVKLDATVVGASDMCLRMVLEAPLPRDAYLVVNLKNHMLFGEVVYCSPSSGTYEVGLLIQESHCLSDLGSVPATLTEILEQERIPAAEYQPDSAATREAELAGQWRFDRSVS